MRAPALLLPLLLSAALATASWAQEGGGKASYRVGPKDLLEIRVFEVSTLNVERRVSDQGSITLPLLGELAVEGRTEEQVAAALKASLEKEYLQRATVSVQVIEFRSRPISVLGAVNKPGNLQLSGR